MLKLIPQRASKLIIFLIYLLFLTSCNASTSKHLDSYKTQTFAISDGTEFKVYIAKSDKQQELGLSKIKSQDFSHKEGMLFPENHMFIRQFWMPETHFDLDVFFMNEDYYILEVHRGLKHFKGKGSRSEVPLSKRVFSQHVLELKANSSLAKKLSPGMSLKVK